MLPYHQHHSSSSGSRSAVVAAVAAGSTCSKRRNKRKASEQFRESRLDEGIQHGKTENDQCSSDNWTTSCWCWEQLKTNSDIRGVPSAATAATVSNGRRKKRQRLEPSRGSRCIIPSKHTTNIGHHNNTNSTNFDDDDDADNILECHHADNHDDDNGTDSDYDSDDDDEESASDNSRRGNGIVVTSEITRNSGGKVGNDRATTVFEKRWNKMYGRLLKYNKQNKTTCVSILNPIDPQLGRWVSHQRTFYKTKNPALTTDRITQLDSIEFVWNTLDTQWTEKYERLVKYKKQNKSTCVPDLYPADPKLGQWVSFLRSCYKTKKSYLTADRITRLDSIGFVWNQPDVQWAEKYDRLVKYKKQNKTTCVPRLYTADPQLGEWVGQQRFNHKNNKSRLTAAKIAQLDSIGFVWRMK